MMMRSVHDGHCTHSVVATLQRTVHHSDVHVRHSSTATLHFMHLMLQLWLHHTDTMLEMPHACRVKHSAYPMACYAGQHDVCGKTHVALCTYTWTFTQDDEEAAAPVSHRRKEVDVEEDDEDDDHDYMTPEGGFTCETVVADGLPKGAGIPTEVWLHNSVIKPPMICSECTLYTVTPAVSLLPRICVMTEHAVLLERWFTLPWRCLPVRAGLQASGGQSICWTCSR